MVIGYEIPPHIPHQSKQNNVCVYRSLPYDWLIILTQSARIGQQYWKNLRLQHLFNYLFLYEHCSRDFYGICKRDLALLKRNLEWSNDWPGKTDPKACVILIFAGSVRTRFCYFIILFFPRFFDLVNVRERCLVPKSTRSILI